MEFYKGLGFAVALGVIVLWLFVPFCVGVTDTRHRDYIRCGPEYYGEYVFPTLLLGKCVARFCKQRIE